ncbi:ImmA/IrrE family metallo-endopeptidase [Eremococcus coleocola]|uniref:ImmA/IrrE family metallo-endopeptidase n=1 Tax=Eremococcus coleocola TaxID=88132 RepID=UPI0003F4DFF1|nr:ImmA/IrrE family metallo-endopeptidase [Eremococcus coleocola]
MKRKTPSDVYDINHKTGALVIGKNRLDDYATKFLNKYCKEALIKPMPIPVEDILNKMSLVIKEERLSSNLDIFGCCLLVDGEIKVYNPETNEYMEKFFEQGTIVLDSLAAEVYGEGSKRNTLIHESLHWEKDKTFFEILRIKNKKLTEKVYPIMLRQSERFYEPPKGNQTKENEVMWLEWQAHKLAPRILMPYSTFKEKAQELINREDITCDEIIQELSDFFKVSKESTKYRLFEVGLEKELSKISDFDRIFEDQLSKNEFVKISYIDAFQMIEKNEVLSNWIDEGKFVFVDGYFVIANQEYIEFKDGKLSLSAKAKRNLKRCVINIRVKRYIEHGISRKKVAFLLKDDGIDKRFYLFKPEDQTHLNREITADELYGYFSDTLDKRKYRR